MWSIRTMECDLAIKRSNVLTHATTWVNLKNTMLSETGQTRKATHCAIPFMWGAQDRQTDRAWTGGQGEGREWAYLLWGDEHVLELEVAAAPPCGWTKCHWTDDLNKAISESPPRAPVAAVPSTSCAPEGFFSTPFRSLSSPTGSRQGLLPLLLPSHPGRIPRDPHRSTQWPRLGPHQRHHPQLLSEAPIWSSENAHPPGCSVCPELGWEASRSCP